MYAARPSERLERGAGGRELGKAANGLLAACLSTQTTVPYVHTRTDATKLSSQKPAVLAGASYVLVPSNALACRSSSSSFLFRRPRPFGPRGGSAFLYI